MLQTITAHNYLAQLYQVLMEKARIRLTVISSTGVTFLCSLPLDCTVKSAFPEIIQKYQLVVNENHLQQDYQIQDLKRPICIKSISKDGNLIPSCERIQHVLKDSEEIYAAIQHKESLDSQLIQHFAEDLHHKSLLKTTKTHQSKTVDKEQIIVPSSNKVEQVIKGKNNLNLSELVKAAQSSVGWKEKVEGKEKGRVNKKAEVEKIEVIASESESS